MYLYEPISYLTWNQPRQGSTLSPLNFLKSLVTKKPNLDCSVLKHFKNFDFLKGLVPLESFI